MIAAIEAGKHVLVEKAFTTNGDDAQALVEAARAKGVFAMEAMWTRFLPHVAQIRQLLADGALGEVVTVFADHGQWFPRDPGHRLFDPALGGGAVGLSAVLAAKAVGAATIIVVDIMPSRLALAQDLGATHVLNGKEADPVAEIKALTGAGVDFSLESTCLPPSPGRRSTRSAAAAASRSRRAWCAVSSVSIRRRACCAS